MATVAPATDADDPYCYTDREMAASLAGARWQRLVVLGDSTAEGLGEPIRGYPSAPWTDRVAAALDLCRGSGYLNLGQRDLLAEDVRRGQLHQAVRFGPDLAIVSAGGNDMLRRRYGPDLVDASLAAIIASLRGAGADVVTIGLFDIASAPLGPAERRAGLQERLWALSRHTQRVAATHGAWHVDLTSHPASADTSIYSTDGIHLNARGHAIAATEVVRRLAAEVESADQPTGMESSLPADVSTCRSG